MSHELTRQELYELVWAEPVSRLAAKFGVSGVAVGKACRRNKYPNAGPRLLGEGYGHGWKTLNTCLAGSHGYIAVIHFVK